VFQVGVIHFVHFSAVTSWLIDLVSSSNKSGISFSILCICFANQAAIHILIIAFDSGFSVF
jgi:hypothetical protein